MTAPARRRGPRAGRLTLLLAGLLVYTLLVVMVTVRLVNGSTATGSALAASPAQPPGPSAVESSPGSGGTSSPSPEGSDPSTQGSSALAPLTVHGSSASIVAVGDIACDPDAGTYKDGQGTGTSCHQRATSDLAVALNPDAVLLLGDIQYEDGRLEAFKTSYEPTWGRLKDITRPAVGNHEYLTDGGADYYTYFGVSAGSPGQGYYSFDLATWHVVVLNSNCSKAGGCNADSPQVTWLREDLNRTSSQCVLAYWHHPRWSNGQHGDHDSVQPFVDALYQAGADVVLAGHDHDYERFAPMAPDGSVDRARGLRTFVVGSGGKNHYAAGRGPTTESVNDDTFGVLSMTLRPGGYDWRFVPEPGKTFTDSGSSNCH